jgi:hypothetical protein
MARETLGTRKVRSPQHTFSIKATPYVLQPFLLAPVLPGETMKNLLLQSRVISDPVKAPLVGWWKEYYFFYVKHRDLDARDLLQEMMLTPNVAVTSLQEAASVDYYSYANAINWSKLCLKRVVEEYFRHENEAWDTYLFNGMPVASLVGETFLNSFTQADEYLTPDVTIDGTAPLTASEVDLALQQWQVLKMHNLTAMTYEDYLRSYGVKTGRVELHRPELIRYVRDWTYPSNTIEPTTGVPTSALSWSITERADKDRFFSEPGFVFGVTTSRPKIYMKNLKGSAAGAMQDVFSWLPATGNPEISYKKFAEGAGPVGGFDDASNLGYWIDMRDLLVYGDQYFNYANTATDTGIIDMPTSAGQRYYPALATIEALFVNVLGKIREDGRVDLSILGRQVDQNPVSMGIG